MKYTVSLLLAAGMLAAAPTGTFAAFNLAESAYCLPGGPESYQREGGFCDQLEDLEGLMKSEGCDVAMNAITFGNDGRLLVAEPIQVECCDSDAANDFVLPNFGAVVEVAIYDPCHPY